MVTVMIKIFAGPGIVMQSHKNSCHLLTNAFSTPRPPHKTHPQIDTKDNTDDITRKKLGIFFERNHHQQPDHY